MDPVFELTFHLGLRAPYDVWARHDHQIESLRVGPREMPETFLQQASGAVAGHCVPDLSAHRQPDSVPVAAIRHANEQKQAPAEPVALLENAFELRPGAETLLPQESHDPSGWDTVQAASFLRPF